MTRKDWQEILKTPSSEIKRIDKTMNPANETEDARQHLKKVNEWLGYLEDNGLKKPEKYIADQVITFDAGSRIGIIWVEREECHSCHQRKQCLVVDQSEGEYLQGIICFDCIDLLRRANDFT